MSILYVEARVSASLKPLLNISRPVLKRVFFTVSKAISTWLISVLLPWDPGTDDERYASA
jgi:hypothetical protein